MEYLPSQGEAIGVSKASTGGFGWDGYDNVFHDFDAAKNFFCLFCDEKIIPNRLDADSRRFRSPILAQFIGAAIHLL